MKILIIGANSAIAKATARLYATPAHDLYLVARNAETLDVVKADLAARGAGSVHSAVADFSDNNVCEAVIDAALTSLGRFDLVIMAHSILGDQKQCEQSANSLMQLYQVNTLSSLSLLTLLANQMAQQRSGTIAFISSVAGDRGRPSNYAYGSSKAAVTSFLQGLRARLARVGVHVLTVKPGFVKTPMTEHIDGDGPLWATPDMIAQYIKKGIEKKRNTIYTPWFWWPIMTIIQSIPESIFKKLNL